MTRRRTQGFTLIELNLALIFVALLLLAIAMVTIYAGTIYQKGVSLKAVNQTGRQVVDQLRRDISATSSNRVKFVDIGVTHRLCLEGVSYVYNDATAMYSSTEQLVRMTPLPSSAPVALIRIDDPVQAWCQTDPLTRRMSLNTTEQASSMELLQQDAIIPTAVHQMSVRQLAQTQGTAEQQALFELTITLGTNQEGTIDTDTQCRPPADNDANFDYCSVREFTTVIRTRGEI